LLPAIGGFNNGSDPTAADSYRHILCLAVPSDAGPRSRQALTITVFWRHSNQEASSAQARRLSWLCATSAVFETYSSIPVACTVQLSASERLFRLLFFHSLRGLSLALIGNEAAGDGGGAGARLMPHHFR
jgi:hypothetical protein